MSTETTPFTEEAILARAVVVREEIARIKVISEPMRASYDEFCQRHEREKRTIVADMKEVEAPLFELQNELSMLSRALGGRSMNVTSK
jgi:hypothetical protein